MKPACRRRSGGGGNPPPPGTRGTRSSRPPEGAPGPWAQGAEGEPRGNGTRSFASFFKRRTVFAKVLGHGPRAGSFCEEKSPSALPRRANLHPKSGEGVLGQEPRAPELPKEGKHGKHCKAEEQCSFMTLFLKGKVAEMSMSAVFQKWSKRRLQQYKVSGRVQGHTKVTFMTHFLKGNVAEMALCPSYS